MWKCIFKEEVADNKCWVATLCFLALLFMFAAIREGKDKQSRRVQDECIWRKRTCYKASKSNADPEILNGVLRCDGYRGSISIQMFNTIVWFQSAASGRYVIRYAIAVNIWICITYSIKCLYWDVHIWNHSESPSRSTHEWEWDEMEFSNVLSTFCFNG